VLSSQQFSVLESDLDCSILLPRPHTATELEQVKAAYRAAQRFLPFLGELEIYENWEHEIKSRILAEYGLELDFITQLRKWTWLKASYDRFESRYHRRKLARSLRRLQKRIGLQLETLFPGPSDGERVMMAALSVLTRTLPQWKNMTVPHFQEFRSGYLGWTIARAASQPRPENNFVIAGSLSECSVLLAICPDSTFLQPQLKDALSEWREDSAVRRLLSAICIHEYITTLSVARTVTPEENPDLPHWSRQLYAFINSLAPTPMIQDLQSHQPLEN
jgi:hypothetical protein